MAHPRAGQARLVGEQPALLVLDDSEAEAQAGAEDDPRRGPQRERPVEPSALQLLVPAGPRLGIDVGAAPHGRRLDARLQLARRLPSAHQWPISTSRPFRLPQTISFAMLMQTMEERSTDRMDERFDLVDARFELVDKRFDDVSAEFHRIDKRFDEVSGEFRRIDKRFDEVSGEFRRIDKRFETVEADIREIRRDLKSTGQELRQEIKANASEIRKEMKENSTELRGSIESMQRNMLYGFMTLAGIIVALAGIVAGFQVF